MPEPVERVFIALGSNIEPRRAAIDSALAHLGHAPGVCVVAVSTIIDTAPVGPIDQPRFLNAVAELATTLEPPALLALLLKVEQLHGRDRSQSLRWGPRTLDLDLILFGHRVVELPHLVIPHPRFAERLFVLEPLAELAADFVPPGFADPITVLRDRCRAAVAGAGRP
ncbi:MAG: 2-amino-4-hydroxy-6-hydroxymethyldihydropteridine diphosphokinase [Phycisphaerales bacterium]|nr:2-amino-4-hydroxy-6-hydroxymethyldihydropteridine diphosphokinase [Phycisphaerales bacterium]